MFMFIYIRFVFICINVYLIKGMHNDIYIILTFS